MFTFYQILQEFADFITLLEKNVIKFITVREKPEIIRKFTHHFGICCNKKKVFHIYPFLDGFRLVPNLTKLFDRGLGSFLKNYCIANITGF